MAVPMTPDQLVNALRAEGLRVITVGEWRTRSRSSGGARPWGPIYGVMNHHTVTRGAEASVRICYDGYAGLPGPLCHAVITKDGTVHVTSAGRANHAGGGDPNVLAAVRDERYNDRPPVPQVGNATGVDGNAHFYGFECENMGDGKDPWPAVQVEAMVRANAAIERFYKWTEKSSIAHAEWSKDKSDPRGPGMPSMPNFRARIKERLAHAPSWSPGTVPTPPTQGPALTKPNRLVVRREGNLTLLQDIPVEIYWETEYQDDGNNHGDGGKTVGINVHYAAVLTARFTGLAEGQNVEITPVEQNSAGQITGAGMASQIWGQREGFHPVQDSKAINGIVGERLAFTVTSRASTPVTLEEIQAVIFSWPNA